MSVSFSLYNKINPGKYICVLATVWIKISKCDLWTGVYVLLSKLKIQKSIECTGYVKIFQASYSSDENKFLIIF